MAYTVLTKESSKVHTHKFENGDNKTGYIYFIRMGYHGLSMSKHGVAPFNKKTTKLTIKGICDMYLKFIVKLNESKVFHNDMKPCNIVLDIKDESVAVKAIDFGHLMKNPDKVSLLVGTYHGLGTCFGVSITNSKDVKVEPNGDTTFFTSDNKEYKLLWNVTKRVLKHILNECITPMRQTNGGFVRKAIFKHQESNETVTIEIEKTGYNADWAFMLCLIHAGFTDPEIKCIIDYLLDKSSVQKYNQGNFVVLDTDLCDVFATVVCMGHAIINNLRCQNLRGPEVAKKAKIDENLDIDNDTKNKIKQIIRSKMIPNTPIPNTGGAQAEEIKCRIVNPPSDNQFNKMLNSPYQPVETPNILDRAQSQSGGGARTTNILVIGACMLLTVIASLFA